MHLDILIGADAENSKAVQPAVLNLATQRDPEGHPKLGASLEGFIIDQIVQQLGVNQDETTIGERIRVQNSTFSSFAAH